MSKQEMNVLVGAVTAAWTGSLVASLLGGAPTATPDDSAAVLATAAMRNVGLQSFTFHADVAMAMRHFPWLHFHIEGTGDYKRNDHYVLTLGNGLPFASGVHQIDLSMIDPSMWPHRYRYRDAGEQNGDSIFTLAPITNLSLKTATVAVSPVSGAQWVDADYTDGTHIHMTVNSDDVQGFLLPATLSAEVDRPHMPLSADATFEDYAIDSSTR